MLKYIFQKHLNKYFPLQNMKEVMIISLGGSLIIPDTINEKLLIEFKQVLLKNKKKYKFVVVCGGGKTARNYIHGLEKTNIKNKELLQTSLGMHCTRLNAKFMIYFFGEKSTNQQIPADMHAVKESLEKNDIVFCGALRYSKEQTSDATSAALAQYLNAKFINITDVAGLYNKNPKKHKNAQFIPYISLKDFFALTQKMKFHPGQHFVLDQQAAVIIKKHTIKTCIIGPDMKNFDNFLNKKHFVGTMIE